MMRYLSAFFLVLPLQSTSEDESILLSELAITCCFKCKEVHSPVHSRNNLHVYGFLSFLKCRHEERSMLFSTRVFIIDKFYTLSKTFELYFGTYLNVFFSLSILYLEKAILWQVINK